MINVKNRDVVKAWLLKYAWAEDTEAEKEAVVECILSQDGWQHIDAVADAFASASESGGGPEAMSEGTLFALSALYECHDEPHLPTCPNFKTEPTDFAPISDAAARLGLRG